jgi:hypothetical protein
MLRFKAGGAGMGEELELAAPGNICVEGSVQFDAQREDLEKLELICNGQVVRSFLRNGDENEVKFRIQYPVDRACWFALRASGRKMDSTLPGNSVRQRAHSGLTSEEELPAGPSLAHSSPVYVTIVGQPPMAKSPEGRAAAWAWMARLGEFEQVVRSRRIEEFTEEFPGYSLDAVSIGLLSESRPALLEIIRESENQYLERMK